MPIIKALSIAIPVVGFALYFFVMPILLILKTPGAL